MSHLLRKSNLGNSALCLVTIIDYVQGGETFTLAELGIAGPITDVTLLQVSGESLIPVFSPPNAIKLMFPSVGLKGYTPVLVQDEIASKIGINYKFVAIVNGA